MIRLIIISLMMVITMIPQIFSWPTTTSENFLSTSPSKTSLISTNSNFSFNIDNILNDTSTVSTIIINNGHRYRRSLRQCGKFLVQAMHLVCEGQYNGPSITSSSSSLLPSSTSMFLAQPSSSLSSDRNQMLQQVRKMVMTMHPQQQSSVSSPRSASSLSSLKELANRLNISLTRVHYDRLNNKNDINYYATSSSTINNHNNNNNYDIKASTETSYIPYKKQNNNIRVRRGIVDECCYNSCSIEAMKQYCAINPNNNHNNHNNNDEKSIIAAKTTHDFHDQ